MSESIAPSRDSDAALPLTASSNPAETVKTSNARPPTAVATRKQTIQHQLHRQQPPGDRQQQQQHEHGVQIAQVPDGIADFTIADDSQYNNSFPTFADYIAELCQRLLYFYFYFSILQITTCFNWFVL